MTINIYINQKTMKSKILAIVILFMIFQSQKGKTQGIIAPGGTGAWGNMVYLGGAFAFPKPYASKSLSIPYRSEVAPTFGFGFGDPVSGIGVQVGSGMLNVSEFDLYSLGVKFHKYFGSGISAALAVENLIIGFSATEVVSLNGSPTVSPMTEAA